MPEQNYSARIIWSEEDEGYVASVPELDGVSAFGETLELAVEELGVAREVWLEALEREPVAPPPFTLPQRSGQFRVRLPRSLHDWLAERADVEGVSLNTFVVQLLSESRGEGSSRHRAEDLERRTG
jgi:antitoxin HicB